MMATRKIIKFEKPQKGIFLGSIFNNMVFWLILGQRRNLVIKKEMGSVVFLATILFLMAYIRPLEIMLRPKIQRNSFFFIKRKIRQFSFSPKKHQSVNNIRNKNYKLIYNPNRLSLMNKKGK